MMHPTTEPSEIPTILKRYANRRLYDPAALRYVGREELGGMTRRGEAFVVYDAATGEDVTSAILPRLDGESG